ncbi:unnamed protein product [Soboliphyme baturini]|uniref:Transmembrane protein n=1 Tax=Soboliphyme baturini TaxID=241478 RepID=A0A183I9X1_9BILA|nr:unnamed protein product [Soboliphyme baturini]
MSSSPLAYMSNIIGNKRNETKRIRRLKMNNELVLRILSIPYLFPSLCNCLTFVFSYLLHVNYIGSTNALACTVHGTDDVLTAILEIALNDNCGVDLCSIHCGDRFFKFACTAVAYGYFGDVLKGSEMLRCFGPSRYLISGSFYVFIADLS